MSDSYVRFTHGNHSSDHGETLMKLHDSSNSVSTQTALNTARSKISKKDFFLDSYILKVNNFNLFQHCIRHAYHRIWPKMHSV